MSSPTVEPFQVLKRYGEATVGFRRGRLAMAHRALIQGRSLLPLLSDPESPWRESFLYAYFFEPPYPTPSAHALVTEDFKWIDYEGLPDELYDLSAPGGESRDLAASPELESRRAALQSALAALRREIEAPLP